MFFACYCALGTNEKVGWKRTDANMCEQVCGYDNERKCHLCHTGIFLSSLNSDSSLGKKHGSEEVIRAVLTALV